MTTLSEINSKMDSIKRKMAKLKKDAKSGKIDIETAKSQYAVLQKEYNELVPMQNQLAAEINSTKFQPEYTRVYVDGQYVAYTQSLQSGGYQLVWGKQSDKWKSLIGRIDSLNVDLVQMVKDFRSKRDQAYQEAIDSGMIIVSSI